MSGMLWGKVLRSPLAHARILSIDVRPALGLPGVKAILTHADVPPALMGIQLKDQPILARGKVRFVGEPVAAIAAVDEYTAAAALALIQVEYEELPALFDPEMALQTGAVLIHEDLDSYEGSIRPAGRKQYANLHSNTLNYVRFQRGDVEKAFAESVLVLEERYRTQAVYPAYLEPHETLASVDEAVTVWTSTQAPFNVRSALAEALGLPQNRVRVIGAPVGGGFGGKITPLLEPLAVLLSMRTGRPVKIRTTRDEDFVSATRRHPTISDLKMGVTRDGQILAVKGRVLFDTGAYADAGVRMADRCYNLQGPYDVPNIDLEGYSIYTNNTPHGYLRGPGSPQTIFAIESHLDAIARKLEIDPIELRLKNAVKEGSLTAQGAILKNVGLAESLLLAHDFLLRRDKSAPHRGWGVACGQLGVEETAKGPAVSSSNVSLRVEEDGSIVLLTGVVEIGGGQTTILGQIVAEGLGVPLEQVSIVAADTEVTPAESGSVASSVTYRVGNTVRLAVEEAREQLINLGAESLEANPKDLALDGKGVYVRGSPERVVSWAALARRAQTSGRGLIVSSSGSKREKWLEALRSEGKAVDAPTYGTHVVEVEVDPETGQVALCHYFAAHDVGFALNPQSLEGQVQGGVVFGIGFALGEEVVSVEGRTLNPTFADYKVCTALDVPKISNRLVEKKSGFGPFGAKGVAELPTVPVAAAIANAIYDAVGVRVTQLPMTPEKVRAALLKKGGP